MLVDTHCHLDRGNFPEGADAVIQRARSGGVGAFIAVGVGGLAVAREAVELAERRRDVVATVGVHPHEASSSDEALERDLLALMSRPCVAAVGEVGLDYYYDSSPRDVQQDVLRRFIAIARQVKKPLVIHTRDARGDTLDILEAERAADVGGVIHCFSEDKAFARRALDLGFDLSFSGIVTFKNATSVHEVAAWAPGDRILVETDSPYLAPVPKRGKKNEPALVEHTARRLAELRGESLSDIEQATTANAQARFGAPLAAAIEVGHDGG